MALFLPTASVEKVTDITPELIMAMKANAILLDVDNTLAIDGSKIPYRGTVEWTRRMRSAGIKIIIMSNNFKKRVAPFAANYNLPFLACSLKPLPSSYWRAVRRLGVRCSEAVAVGDQIFTDIVGANLSHVKSILLVPISEETSLSFFIRRFLEKSFRKKIKKSGRGKEYFQ